MKKLNTLLLIGLCLLTFASCGDDDNDRVDETPVPLTKEALVGEWETTKIYYTVVSNYPELSKKFSAYMTNPDRGAVIKRYDIFKGDGSTIETYFHKKEEPSIGTSYYTLDTSKSLYSRWYSAPNEDYQWSEKVILTKNKLVMVAVESELGELEMSLHEWASDEQIVLPENFKIDIEKSGYTKEYRRIK